MNFAHFPSLKELQIKGIDSSEILAPSPGSL